MTLHPYQSAFGALGSAVVVSDCRRSFSKRLVDPAPPVCDAVRRLRDDDPVDDPRDDPVCDDVFDRLERRDEVLADVRVDADDPDDVELVRPEELVERDDPDELDDPDERDGPDELDDPDERDEPDDDHVERDEVLADERDDELVEDLLDDPFPACPGNLNLLRPSSRLST